MDERYSRQIAFNGIGEGGQRKLGASRVCIVGLGALGTAAADRLCRAGVGALRLIDDDYVEPSNLQRQTLYIEADVGDYKCRAAAKRLWEINSEMKVYVEKYALDASNANGLLKGCDVVLDCTDNFAARHIINETCHKLVTPWIHGAAAGSTGTVFAVVPGGPCFRCLYPNPDLSGESAATSGMLGTLTGIVGALQANEAIKLLVGAEPAGLLMFDVWRGTFDTVPLERNPGCPVCGGSK